MLKTIILYCLICLGSGYKIISIQPGGLKGFYMLGVCKYIKDNYLLDNFEFYGSSAGAWNALYLSLPLNNEMQFLNDMSMISRQFNYSNLYEVETLLKNILINNINTQLFQEKSYKCNICLSSCDAITIQKKIKNDFESLEDLIECCIASSHLPLLSNGRIFYIYKNKKYVDGGIFRNNYPLHVKPNLIIYPNMFNNKDIFKFSTLRKLDITQLIDEGYYDAMMNMRYLDDCLL